MIIFFFFVWPCAAIKFINLPKIDWNTLITAHDGILDVLYDCLSKLRFSQMVNDITHISSIGNANTLDLIFCNNPICITIDKLDASFGTSDHSVVNFSIAAPHSFPSRASSSSPSFSHTSSNTQQADNIDTHPPPNIEHIYLTVYDWSSADFSAMNDVMQTIDWHSIFGFHFTANAIWNEFKNIL